MKILITGGDFLGLRLARRLLDEGHRVRVLDVAPKGAGAVREIEWQQGDVSSWDAVKTALEDCDGVVHLAGLLTPACQADPVRGLQVNALGTLLVFEAARRRGLPHVVYASSAGVYGPHDAQVAAPTTLYGTWKLAGEGIARSYLADHGIGSVGLRPFIVYGSGREVGLSSGPSLACRAAARGESYTIPFTGASGMVYVDDVIDALAAALQPRTAGAHVFNMAGVKATVDDVIAEIARQVPGARIDAKGPPLPISADIRSDGLGPVLGLTRTTSLREGIAATLAACRGN